jgi:hypothetical protein
MYLGFSVCAALLVGVLVFTTPTDTPIVTISDKILIASIFITCCLLGISFTISPNWIRRYRTQKTKREKNQAITANRMFQGHHPDCSLFQKHTLFWKNKTWCAGCLGLLIGLCASIIFMITYLFTTSTPPKMISSLLILLGVFICMFVFFEVVYRNNHPLLHVFSNSLFAPSFFLITINVVGLTGNIVFGLFTILLCFLWLDTRIQLSSWRHRSLCMKCPESCKMYESLG